MNHRRQAVHHPSSHLRLAPDPVLVRVLLVFAGVYILLWATLWLAAYRGGLEPLMMFTARIAGASATLTGAEATVVGRRIFLADRILDVDIDCTAVQLMAVYAALVFAYPLSGARKLCGLALGLPVLFAVNVARLTAIAHLSDLLEGADFVFAHDYLFMVAMVAAVVALWASYLASARRRAR